MDNKKSDAALYEVTLPCNFKHLQLHGCQCPENTKCRGFKSVPSLYNVCFPCFLKKNTLLINICFVCSYRQNNELGKNKEWVQHLLSAKTPILSVIGLEKMANDIECNMGIQLYASELLVHSADRMF